MTLTFIGAMVSSLVGAIVLTFVGAIAIRVGAPTSAKACTDHRRTLAPTTDSALHRPTKAVRTDRRRVFAPI